MCFMGIRIQLHVKFNHQDKSPVYSSPQKHGHRGDPKNVANSCLNTTGVSCWYLYAASADCSSAGAISSIAAGECAPLVSTLASSMT